MKRKKKKIEMIIRVTVSPPINKTIWNAQLCMQFVSIYTEVLISQLQYDINWVCSIWGRHISSDCYFRNNSMFGLWPHWIVEFYCKDTTKRTNTQNFMLLINPNFPLLFRQFQLMRRGKCVGDHFVHAHVVRGEITTVCGPQ